MASVTNNVWFYVGIIAIVVAIIMILVYFFTSYKPTWLWVGSLILGILGIIFIIIAYTTSKPKTRTIDASRLGLGQVEVGVDNRGVYATRIPGVTTIGDVIDASTITPVRIGA